MYAIYALVLGIGERRMAYQLENSVWHGVQCLSPCPHHGSGVGFARIQIGFDSAIRRPETSEHRSGQQFHVKRDSKAPSCAPLVRSPNPPVIGPAPYPAGPHSSDAFGPECSAEGNYRAEEQMHVVVRICMGQLDSQGFGGLDLRPIFRFQFGRGHSPIAELPSYDVRAQELAVFGNQTRYLFRRKGWPALANVQMDPHSQLGLLMQLRDSIVRRRLVHHHRCAGEHASFMSCENPFGGGFRQSEVVGVYYEPLRHAVLPVTPAEFSPRTS